ncbi:MAG: hypothetical protein WC717_04295 [Candidatus Micrarchaeia archaeon]|jgi:glycosyltransferase involved in cell wall biosynthesis
MEKSTPQTRLHGRGREASFIYAGRRGSNLECAIALHKIAQGMGWSSNLVLSSDNERAGKVRALYPEANFLNFFSPLQVLRLRKSLSKGIAFFTMLSPKMAPILLSMRSPRIFYFHASYDYSYSKRTARDAYFEHLHRLLMRSSSMTVATQPSLARQIKKNAGVDAGVLPHPPYSPIDPEFFSDEKPVRLPFRKGEYFLNFGEISRESKGTGLLLEAVRGTSLPVVLAGRREGVHSARNIFHINRWVDDAELYWLIKNCRAIVLPYLLRSQFSGCLALAFHFRKPVLAPGTEAFEGWVEHGSTGWLFRHADARDLRLKMQQISSGRLKFSPRAIAAKEKERERITASALKRLLEKLPPSRL